MGWSPTATTLRPDAATEPAPCPRQPQPSPPMSAGQGPKPSDVRTERPLAVPAGAHPAPRPAGAAAASLLLSMKEAEKQRQRDGAASTPCCLSLEAELREGHASAEQPGWEGARRGSRGARGQARPRHGRCRAVGPAGGAPGAWTAGWRAGPPGTRTVPAPSWGACSVRGDHLHSGPCGQPGGPRTQASVEWGRGAKQAQRPADHSRGQPRAWGGQSPGLLALLGGRVPPPGRQPQLTSPPPGSREGSLARGGWPPEAQPCPQARRCLWGWGGGWGGQGVYLSSLLNWGWASAISRLLLNIALLQQEQSEKTELLLRPRQAAQEAGPPHLRAGHSPPAEARRTGGPARQAQHIRRPDGQGGLRGHLVPPQGCGLSPQQGPKPGGAASEMEQKVRGVRRVGFPGSDPWDG